MIISTKLQKRLERDHAVPANQFSALNFTLTAIAVFGLPLIAGLIVSAYV